MSNTHYHSITEAGVPQQQQQVAAVTSSPLRIRLRRIRYLMRKHITPKRKLAYRSFVVFVLTIVNIVLMFTNLKKGKNDMAIACGAIMGTLIVCLTVMLKVGHRSLALKVREWEGRRLAGASGTKGEEAVPPIPISADAAYIIVDRNDEDSRDHPSVSCVFRRHPSALIPAALFFFLCSICTAIYYLTLGIEKGIAPTMTNLQDTFYMCFILYMFCAKWCFLVVLLLRAVRNEGYLYRSGHLLRVEADAAAREEADLREYEAFVLARHQASGVAVGGGVEGGGFGGGRPRAASDSSSEPLWTPASTSTTSSVAKSAAAAP